MNLNRNPTIDQLIQIIAAVDDAQDSHILYVNKNGDVHLVPLRSEMATGADYANETTLQFILDTYTIGEGCTGTKASQDQEWMDGIFMELNDHWARKTTGFA